MDKDKQKTLDLINQVRDLCDQLEQRVGGAEGKEEQMPVEENLPPIEMLAANGPKGK